MKQLRSIANRPIASRLSRYVLAISFVLVLAGVAAACPTCKDQLAHDPASANLARGYAMSILFMLSMPPLIFGTLCAYFYWEVRKARARQAEMHSANAGNNLPEGSAPLVAGH